MKEIIIALIIFILMLLFLNFIFTESVAIPVPFIR